MKSFLSQLVSRLDIDNGTTRVGVVTYSTAVGITINLNAFSSVVQVQSAISTLDYLNGATNTHLALKYVRSLMLTSVAGDRSNVPNVVVVLTDGKSTHKTPTQVSVCRLLLSIALRYSLPE